MCVCIDGGWWILIFGIVGFITVLSSVRCCVCCIIGDSMMFNLCVYICGVCLSSFVDVRCIFLLLLCLRVSFL